jgi:hypothetical protein
VRDLLRADGVEDKVEMFDRTATLDAVLRADIVEKSLLPNRPLKSEPMGI